MSNITTVTKIGDETAIKAEKDMLSQSKVLIESSATMTDKDISDFIETYFPNFSTNNKTGIAKMIKTTRANARITVKMIKILKAIT